MNKRKLEEDDCPFTGHFCGRIVADFDPQFELNNPEADWKIFVSCIFCILTEIMFDLKEIKKEFKKKQRAKPQR